MTGPCPTRTMPRWRKPKQQTLHKPLRQDKRVNSSKPLRFLGNCRISRDFRVLGSFPRMLDEGVVKRVSHRVIVLIQSEPPRHPVDHRSTRSPNHPHICSATRLIFPIPDRTRCMIFDSRPLYLDHFPNLRRYLLPQIIFNSERLRCGCGNM